MRNKVLPVLTNAINPSLSGSDSGKNDWILCIHISPSALIPAKHLFIHWSRSGSHGTPIMCSPEQRTAPAAVSNQECSIPRLIWWGAEQNLGWVTDAMAVPQLPGTPPAADSQNRATVPCSTRVWVGQPAPILFLLPEPELVYLLNSTALQWKEDCWHLLNFTPTFQHCFFSPYPKKSHSSLWGSEGDGEGSTGVNDPWQRGRATEKTPIQSSHFLLFCKWFSCARILGDPPRSTKYPKQCPSVVLDMCTLCKAGPNPNRTAVIRLYPPVCIRPSRQRGLEEELDTNIPVKSHGREVQAGNQELQLLSTE